MIDPPTTQGPPVYQGPPYVAPPPKPPRKGLRIAGLIVGGCALLGAGVGIGAADASQPAKTVAMPGPTVTMPVSVPGPTVTVAGPTVTVKPAPPPVAGATMAGDGTFLVGYKAGDWAPGTWQSGTPPSGNCYWATLSNLTGAGATSGIIQNNNSAGPSVFTVTGGVVGVQVSGCGTWHKIS